jgi:hypothetical protein
LPSFGVAKPFPTILRIGLGALAVHQLHCAAIGDVTHGKPPWIGHCDAMLPRRSLKDRAVDVVEKAIDPEKLRG